MKFVKSALVLATASVCQSASAANLFGGTVDGKPYVGVKVGKLDYSGKVKPMSYGVVAGYQYDPNVGVELEYLGSEEKKESGTVRIGAGDQAVDVAYAGSVKGRHYGVYGHYRYNFDQSPIYAKGRVGLVNSEVNIKTTTTDERFDFARKQTSTGMALGANVGYQATPNLGVELGLTRYQKLKSQDYKTNAKGIDVTATYRF